MSEFERYEPDYEDSTIQFAVGDVFVMSLCDNGDWCLYDDVAPIIQRNAELTEELARLREQEPVCHVSGFDRVWWNDKFTSPDEVPKMNTPLYADPKPAQEIPSELVKWANEYVEIIDDYSLGDADSRFFVKSQLEKMKGQKND
jgi:hypothetical protein